MLCLLFLLIHCSCSDRAVPARADASALDLQTLDRTLPPDRARLPAPDLARQDRAIPDARGHHAGKILTLHSGTKKDLYSIWGISSVDLFVGGADGTVLRSNGKTWTAMNTGVTGAVVDIWGSGASDVYAVTDKQVIHYDGKSWKKVPSMGGSAVWGTGPDNVWIASDQTNAGWPKTIGGVVYHFDGKSWSKLPMQGLKPGWFRDVWASDPKNIWLTHDANTSATKGTHLYHHNGASLTLLKSGTPWTTYHTVWGTGPADIYALGSLGLDSLHHDGKCWTRLQPPGNRALIIEEVWGSGKNNLFFLTVDPAAARPPSSQELYHFDGARTWTRIITWIGRPKLNRMWGPGVGHVHLVGNSGMILLYRY